MHPRFFAYLAALAVLLTPGCKPPAPENIRVKEQVSGPPDLVKAEASAHLANHAYQLRAFHLNHVWAGAAPRHETDHSYRAKITLWDYADDESAVAELYFDDDASRETAANPDPSKTPRPYRIHFPVTALAPILATLRGTNEPIFLYYYDSAWAVGTYVAEPVGAD